MSAAISIVALALATVLMIAGAAKMADLEGSRKAVAAFGIPPRLARMIGTVLPAAELVTAALLISGVAGAGTLLNLGAFFALAMLAALGEARTTWPGSVVGVPSPTQEYLMLPDHPASAGLYPAILGACARHPRRSTHRK